MPSASKCAVPIALCFTAAAGLALKSSDAVELVRGKFVADLEPSLHIGEASTIRDSRADIPWSWFQNKNVLFLGDSTMEEIFWEVLYTLNETQEAVAEIPSRQCQTESCASLCHNFGVTEQDELWQHYSVRCADGDKLQCKDALPVLQQKYNMNFNFFWTGNQHVCDNGIGLTGAWSDSKWKEAFQQSVVAKGPYDLVLFTAGNHDYVLPTGDTESNFKLALGQSLSEQGFKLGKKNVFLLSSTSEGRGAAMDMLNQPQNKEWTVIDRHRYHPSMHCAFKHVNSTYVDYSRQPTCHTLVETIVEQVAK